MTRPRFPFAGMHPDRSGLAALSADAWAQVPLHRVCLADLVLTQKKVRIAPLFGQFAPEYNPDFGDPYPHVVICRGGNRFLVDGHHRVVRAALLGETAMAMRVHTMGGPR